MLTTLLKSIPDLIRRKIEKSKNSVPCPICKSSTDLHDALDFNKSCEDPKGKIFPTSGRLIEYNLCPHCGFCFAPEFQNWSEETFAEEIYNDQYALVDPDYLHARPYGNANLLKQILGSAIQLSPSLTHLDYGGGSGLLSQLLKEYGWISSSHDRFVNKQTSVHALGKFDIVTAFEVFEHVPNPDQLFDDINALSHENTLLLFSTLLSDGQIDSSGSLSWWYAAPRNGHTSLFSSNSLKLALSKHGYTLNSLSPGLHLAWKSRPEWFK